MWYSAVQQAVHHEPLPVLPVPSTASFVMMHLHIVLSEGVRYIRSIRDFSMMERSLWRRSYVPGIFWLLLSVLLPGIPALLHPVQIIYDTVWSENS